MHFYIFLALVLSGFLGTYGFRTFMKMIPNADRVMNPCDPVKLWEGVGHLKPGGYGARNSFGLDFYRNGKVWSTNLCRLDSDGDGRTNGEELGDPECTWKPGSDVNITTTRAITHPGICEPLDSPTCKAKNSWLTCEEKFKCNVIIEPTTKNFTVNVPRMEVPVVETVHKCVSFEFPQDGDFHMVATTPFLDNKAVMHHILIFGCDNDKELQHGVGEVFDCGFTFDPACTDIIAVWLLGMDGECMHENSGFRIGSKGYRRGGLQIHWENQQLQPGLFDGSGMTIYYIENRRMHDAGILFIGQEYFAIPPGRNSHTEVGHCYPECTERKWSEDLHVTFAVNHMHYLGRSQSIEHLRDGEVMNVITNELDFDFDSPRLHIFKEPIVIKPGDEIKTICHYNSTSRDVTTVSGAGYRQEMCFGFLTFYPKQAITNGATVCTSWKTIPQCRFELDETVNGCDFKYLHNLSHPVTKARYDRVMEHCRPFGPCFEDCRTVVRELSQLPCFHGDMWEWQRNKMGGDYDNTTNTANWYRFYAAIDSCLNKDYDETSNSASSLNKSIILLFCLLALRYFSVASQLL